MVASSLQQHYHSYSEINVNLNQMVVSSLFPPGTPVWYNIKYVDEFTNHNMLRAYEGVVRSVSHSAVRGTVVCEVIRFMNKDDGDSDEIFVETVDVNSMAYGSGCLVHVKTQCTNSTTNSTEMKGEIIIPHFLYESGKAMITYTVKLIMTDGSIIIENGVSPERIQYRFGLDRLRAKLKNEYSNKMVAIRTGTLGLPMRKRRSVALEQNLKIKIKKILHIDNEEIAESSETVRYPNESKNPKKSRRNCNSSPLNIERCKHNTCSRYGQKEYEGYCFVHYYFLLKSKKNAQLKLKEQTHNNTGTSSNTQCRNKSSTSETELVDLTEE